MRGPSSQVMIKSRALPLRKLGLLHIVSEHGSQGWSESGQCQSVLVHGHGY